jgi:hypothetical protein
MMKVTLTNVGLWWVLGGLASLLGTAAEEPAEKPSSEQRQRLSLHQTVAEFQGLEYRVCRGLTSQCPEHCGDSGEFALFRITDYLKYEKPGKYGDSKQKVYRVQVSDYDRKPLKNPWVEVIRELKKGDAVHLNWRHDYVTTKGGSKFPERVVTKLEKIADSESSEGGQGTKAEVVPEGPVPGRYVASPSRIVVVVPECVDPAMVKRPGAVSLPEPSIKVPELDLQPLKPRKPKPGQ